MKDIGPLLAVDEGSDHQILDPFATDRPLAPA